MPANSTSLTSLKDRKLRMRLIILTLTLGLDSKDKVICKEITILKNSISDTEIRIVSDKIAFLYENKETINGTRTFITITTAVNDKYVIHLLNHAISDARSAGELPPVAENVSANVINYFSQNGGTETIGSDGKKAIILPIS